MRSQCETGFNRTSKVAVAATRGLTSGRPPLARILNLMKLTRGQESQGGRTCWPQTTAWNCGCDDWRRMCTLLGQVTRWEARTCSQSVRQEAGLTWRRTGL